ncbi:MAG TPA: dihydrofolate reductase family protein [Thermoplasmata archaeon]|nr:dihydrofolate reductase family protein [Thermoplasmata archaeon]
MNADRPEILVNCAVSLDGRLACAGGRRALLSGPEDLVRVQRMRASASAIVVGAGTVISDDPSLRVHWDMLGEAERAGPVRVVLDSMGRIPDGARVLDGTQPTLIVTAERCRRRFPPTVETVVGGADRVELPQLWTLLSARGMRSVMVEGGGNVIASVLRSGEFDRMTVYVAPVVIGGRTAPSLAIGPECADESGLQPVVFLEARPLGTGVLLTYGPPRAGPS